MSVPASGDASRDFDRLEALFDRVVDLDLAARHHAVDEAFGDRPDLAYEIDALLAAHDRLLCGGAAADEEAGPGVGSTVGAWRLVEPIGAGGMGAVYRAARADGAFRQEVAVKLLRSVLTSEDARRRFRVERQILASLQHPHIVRLLDGGTTPDGHAYFVMEHVAGVPITRYCRDRRLSLTARVRLLRDVCAAVQHAHQHAVVHRDLKPANILVTDEGMPKVLDFGVAKLVEGPAAVASATAGVLPAPLTPNYASPEQWQGLAVTTASDVYALGVLLYEILSGARPYDAEGRPLDRALDMVLHHMPARPSAAADTEGILPYACRALRGDLDAIVLRALSKAPADRYQSASELSSDLSRWLDGQPVIARGPSHAYVLRRLAARHRVLVAAVAVSLVAIVTASAVAWWQGRVATREQARAERRFSEVREIANRVLFDYQAALRELTGATDLRARMIADSLRYLDALAADGPADPELQLEIARGYITISEVQGATRIMSLGDRANAVASLQKAEALLADLVARVPSFERGAFSHAALGCYFARVEPDRAAEHGERCLAGVEPFAARWPSDGFVQFTLGQAHLQLAETGSEEHARQAIAVLSRAEAASPENLRMVRLGRSYAHRLLGWRLLDRGEARQALEHGEASAALLVALIDEGNTLERRMDQAFTRQLIGRSAVALGDRARARQALEQALHLIQTALRDNPHDAFVQDRLVGAYRILALSLEEIGEPGAAAGVYREAVERMPGLTAVLEAPAREWTRGVLYAGHARLNFASPPCDVLRKADEHLTAARVAGTLPRGQERRADWVRTSLARCGETPWPPR